MAIPGTGSELPIAPGIAAESPQDLPKQIRGLAAESPVFCGQGICGANSLTAKKAPKFLRTGINLIVILFFQKIQKIPYLHNFLKLPE
jgi:hypothetical protein